MNMLPECEYNLVKASPEFLSTVENLNCQPFVQSTRLYIELVVREFYADIQDEQGGKVVPHSIVRRKVFFEPERINSRYMLVCESDEYEKKLIVLEKRYGESEK